jgi:hypothetical protein
MESLQNQKTTLAELAKMLVTPERYGDAALQDTVEFDPIPEQPTAQILQFPHQLQLRDPAELGWERDPGPETAA